MVVEIIHSEVWKVITIKAGTLFKEEMIDGSSFVLLHAPPFTSLPLISHRFGNLLRCIRLTYNGQDSSHEY